MEFKGRFLGFIIDNLDATNLIERLKLQLSAFHFLCANKDFIVNYKFTIKSLVPMHALRAMHAMPTNKNGVPYVPIPVNMYQSLNFNSLKAQGRKQYSIVLTWGLNRVSCPTVWANTIIYSSNQKWTLNRCSFIFEFFSLPVCLCTHWLFKHSNRQ